MTAPQPSLYRTPQTPGFMGSYNWVATIFGLAILVLFSTLSTQYIAARFAYQPALGSPLVRTRTCAVYQPFAWAIWGWEYCMSKDPRIRQPLFEGEMIVFAGSILSVVLFFVFAGRRARRLSKDAEDLHGSARWAAEPDIRATGLLDTARGVYVGGWHDERTGHLHYLRHNGPEHVLAFAPTRSGKGVGLVIPTLLAWEESAVVYDIKGENWAKTAGFRSKQGHLCFKFSPVEEGGSSRFNPLSEVRLFTRRDVADAQNVANMIVRTGEDSPQERYWQDAAVSITTGMILHACYAAAAEGRVACLSDLANAFTRPGSSFRETLEGELLNYPHDPQYKYGWRMPNGDRTATHPTVREKVQEMLDKEDRDFGGVLSTAKTALTLYSDPVVASNTSASDFTIDSLVNHEQPASLYLVVPPSDKIRLRPLIRLMFTMVVNRLSERMAFDGAEQKRNRHRLLLLIDEFPSLNRMEVFADALSYMAGYGLKAYLITQDIRQIVDAYGQNESIVSNCHIRIAFAPNQFETAELLSKMTGTKTVQKTELDLMDVIALDKVQKNRPLDEESFKRLKARKLIEGRRPNLFVSAKIAAATGDKAAYIKNRAFDKQHYKDMVVAYLEKFGEATRADLDELLLEKLSDKLDPKQKRHSITNLLQEMKRAGQIVPDGTTRWAKWRMSKPAPEGDRSK